MNYSVFTLIYTHEATTALARIATLLEDISFEREQRQVEFQKRGNQYHDLAVTIADQRTRITELKQLHARASAHMKNSVQERLDRAEAGMNGLEMRMKRLSPGTRLFLQIDLWMFDQRENLLLALKDALFIHQQRLVEQEQSRTLQEQFKQNTATKNPAWGKTFVEHKHDHSLSDHFEMSATMKADLLPIFGIMTEPGDQEALRQMIGKRIQDLDFMRKRALRKAAHELESMITSRTDYSNRNVKLKETKASVSSIVDKKWLSETLHEINTLEVEIAEIVKRMKRQNSTTLLLSEHEVERIELELGMLHTVELMLTGTTD